MGFWEGVHLVSKHNNFVPKAEFLQNKENKTGFCTPNVTSTYFAFHHCAKDWQVCVRLPWLLFFHFCDNRTRQPALFTHVTSSFCLFLYKNKRRWAWTGTSQMSFLAFTANCKCEGHFCLNARAKGSGNPPNNKPQADCRCSLYSCTEHNAYHCPKQTDHMSGVQSPTQTNCAHVETAYLKRPKLSSLNGS